MKEYINDFLKTKWLFKTRIVMIILTTVITILGCLGLLSNETTKFLIITLFIFGCYCSYQIVTKNK